MASAAPITADLAARAIVAAAISFGDDPVLAITSLAPPKRRARVCAARALVDELGLTVEAAAKLLAVAKASLVNVHAYGADAQRKAMNAAREAIRAAAPAVRKNSGPNDRGGNVTPLADYLKPKAARAPVTHPSSRSGARTAACDLPGREKGLSERDARLAAQEHEFVMSKREAGVPWSHIAQQLAVGVTALRRRHDPEFAG
jgi:hypothetical protein